MARTDHATAVRDLEATPEQAFLVAAHAMAWRAVAALVPIAVLVGVALLISGAGSAASVVIVPALAIVVPVVAVTLLTMPVAWVAWGQTLGGGSRDARLRFGVTGLVYVYYGWRYAFRGRRRPWGALSVEEKRSSDPKRAAAYWPSSPEP